MWVGNRWNVQEIVYPSLGILAHLLRMVSWNLSTTSVSVRWLDNPITPSQNDMCSNSDKCGCSWIFARNQAINEERLRLCSGCSMNVVTIYVLVGQVTIYWNNKKQLQSFKSWLINHYIYKLSHTLVETKNTLVPWICMFDAWKK